MPKLPNVTMHELEDAIDAISTHCMDLREFADRIGKGYCQPIDDLNAKLRGLAGIIGAANDLSSALIYRAQAGALRDEVNRLKSA